MRKNVFRKIAQSICIGAIGLLAGTSLDYAYSGYGMLENPNLWAESTTTADEDVKNYSTMKDCSCRGILGEYTKDPYDETKFVNAYMYDIPSNYVYCGPEVFPSFGNECIPNTGTLFCIYTAYDYDGTILTPDRYCTIPSN